VPEDEGVAVTADFDEPQGIAIEGGSGRDSFRLLLPRAVAEDLMTSIERALADLNDEEMQEFHKS
jgi:hypothetical protein